MQRREVRLQRWVHQRVEEDVQQRQREPERRLSVKLALLAVLLAWSVPVVADPIAGRASVIDGDTIEIHGERIRLEGIDAPESRQICTDSSTGEQIRCGQRAAIWLSEWIGAKPVTCTEAGRDRYNRMLAHCTVAGHDIGAAMVSAGWALAYVRYSAEYVDQEARARDAKAGIWQWEFTPPWEWRRAQRER